MQSSVVPSLTDLASQALSCLARNDFEEANRLCREVLLAGPDDALSDLVQGLLLDQKGLTQEAVELLYRAIKSQPDHPAFHFALGTVFKRQGETRLAHQCFLRVLELNPSEAELLMSLGSMLLSLNKLDEARDAFCQGLRIRPNHERGLEGLANVYLRQDNRPAAEHFYRSALRANPHLASALNNYANLLAQTGRTAQAEECYRKAIGSAPSYGDAHFNLGNLCARADRLDEAICHYQNAVSLTPGSAAAWDTLANTLNDTGDVEQALSCWDKAIALDPGWAQTRWNRSLALLKQGRFQEGWHAYESRLEMPNLIPPREFLAPAWQGEEFHGQTLLITAEQGLGDAIQFIRYAALVKARGGSVVVECQPSLVRLFQTCPGVDDVVCRGGTLPLYHWHVSLLSLPYIFQTTLTSIPAQVPYLGRSVQRKATLRDRELKVGLAWAGNPRHVYDRRRSCRLEQLRSFFELQGVRWVRMQKDVPEHDAAELASCPLLDSPADRDLMDAAEVVSQLDLVISVDTSIAHLAGALNVPVWILLSAAPDWRWMTEREDSPWYPSARLFRQRRLGDWEELASRIGNALRGWIVARPSVADK